MRKALKEKAEKAVQMLSELYPDAACSLEYGGDPWRLLVMGRLSAQCTDERVNIVCRDLFKKFPSARDMAYAELNEVETSIKSCGLYHSKATSLIDFSKIIVEEYDGKVPDTMEELLLLPGVGRKIANLILGDIYHKGGIVADTHCMRICGRLGFYEDGKKDPLFTEKTMDPLISKDKQSDFCHRLVLFGRDICSAKNPKCEECHLIGICKYGKAKR